MYEFSYRKQEVGMAPEFSSEGGHKRRKEEADLYVIFVHCFQSVNHRQDLRRKGEPLFLPPPPLNKKFWIYFSYLKYKCIQMWQHNNT
jgi:hypothetical protein